jgi:predicted RNA-binding Zn ribbon-like protein
MAKVQLVALERIGGAVCLDFVNTVDPRHRVATRVEYLPDYDSLVRWARTVGLVDQRQARRLADIADRRGRAAKRVLQRAVALREALYELLSQGRSASDSSALRTLNTEYERAMSARTIEPAVGGFRRSWLPTDELDRILWPIAECGADLLTSPLVAKVRECQGDDCGWLFLDTSKGGRRRWCSMADCGNRAKAKRRRRIGVAASPRA